MPAPACGFRARGLCVCVFGDEAQEFVTGSQLMCRAVTSHVMDQPHCVMWLPANTTQQELHSDKHNPTWHIHGKIGTKSFLKVEFPGCIYSSPECSRESCEAVYHKREWYSNRIGKAALIQRTIRKKTYVFSNSGECFCCMDSCKCLSFER